ncbi:hypothetical protein [Endozoicomonas acroporae]|uniref:hypothetical protein n=1 Tax=Endozoicomonas acroporae TaxID=1701104 RepID=UPI003D7955CA
MIFRAAFRAATVITLSSILLAFGVKASEKEPPALSPATIIQQQIMLNDILISIHRLQLDFLDQDARNALQLAQQSVNITINTLPESLDDPEANKLLVTVVSLWPVVNKHITWLSTIPASSAPPSGTSLLRVLAKMDRQLLLLRQKVTNVLAGDKANLRFLEQALLMQYMTRDYLNLLVSEQNTEIANTNQMQLKAQAKRFHQRMTAFNDELGDHPHAMVPVKQANAAWSFIHSSFERFPERKIPDLIVRYGKRIVRRLSSVQRML